MDAFAADATFDLVAVGDVSLGDIAQGVGGGVHARFERVHAVRPAYPFEHTAELLGNAEIVFGNLETVVSHTNLWRWSAASMEMRGHPAATSRLANAGFTVMNVANNHMMQHGSAAFQETVESLRSRQIRVVGVAAAGGTACIPEEFVVNGLRVAILGFAFEEDKYSKGPVDYAFGPKCDIAGQVRRAKASSDVVICSVHWGVEFLRHPAAWEEELGRQLVDAGATLVLGHHPHVARRVERYAHGLIAYSLGNFVFDMLWDRWLRTGLVLRARLSRGRVEDYTVDLVWIGDDCQPRPMLGQERADAMAAFTDLGERPSWVSDTTEYNRQYEEAVARNRHQSYRHFIANIGRRPLGYTAQALLRTARRKAAGALPVRFASR